MFHVADDAVHVAGYRPEELLDHGAGAQVDKAQREAVQRLVAYLQRVVPVLEQSRLVDFVPNLIDVAHQLVIVLADGVHLLVPLRQRGGLEHIHDEHRVMSCQGAAALVDDVGMLEAVLVASVHERIDSVVDILLDAVVHRVATAAGARAVVIHAQSAANVDILHLKAQLGQLHIELCSLAQGVLDAANLGDLAADVEVDEFEAVFQLVLMHIVNGTEQLAGVQAELAAVAAALFPLAAAAARQLDAEADVRADVQSLGNPVDEFQFAQFLNDDKDAASHLLCQQSELDVALVLVTVADDDRVGIQVGHVAGEDGVQLGFAAGFEADVELLAVPDDLLDDLSHLVHLDGIDDEIGALVLILLGRLLEAAGNLVDAVVQNVGEAQQYGCRHLAGVQLVHDICQVHRHAVALGGDSDMTVLVDREVLEAPASDVVEFGAILDAPLVDC